MILRDKDKKSLISIVKRTIQQPVKLWAFGSRVTGDAHDTSDLDLVLISKNEKINIDDLMNLKDSLKKSNIPIIIQVLDWNRIPTSFHDNILNNYEVIL